MAPLVPICCRRDGEDEGCLAFLGDVRLIGECIHLARSMSTNGLVSAGTNILPNSNQRDVNTTALKYRTGGLVLTLLAPYNAISAFLGVPGDSPQRLPSALLASALRFVFAVRRVNFQVQDVAQARVSLPRHVDVNRLMSSTRSREQIPRSSCQLIGSNKLFRTIPQLVFLSRRLPLSSPIVRYGNRSIPPFTLPRRSHLLHALVFFLSFSPQGIPSSPQ